MKFILSLLLTVIGLLPLAAESIMYPACFQKNIFNICENFPGSMGFFPLNEPQTKKAVLHLEIPAFLKYRFSGFAGGNKNDPAIQVRSNEMEFPIPESI